jgi:phospholipid/cholesterol/gamma-HCH transport system substrate-binding protein
VNLRISKPGAIATLIACAAAAIFFFVLLARFGGPSLQVSDPYRLSVTIPDTKGLSPGSEVLTRGVHVGEVESIDVRGDAAEVGLRMDDRYAPIDRKATVRVGQKTLFGEAYVDLEPGGRGAGDLPSGGHMVFSQVLPEAVDVDQALKILDEPARRNLRSALGTFAEADASDESGERMNQTLAQLSRVTGELRTMTDTLRDQRDDIAVGVSSARDVVGTLADHDSALSSIVSDGRATLQALGSRDSALRAGVGELPELLSSARTTLHDARPLLSEARPLTDDLDRAAPPLGAALDDLPPAVVDANSVLDGLPELERVADPFLSETTKVLRRARPAVKPLEAAVRNAEPIAGFLSDRRQAFAAWFSNTGDLGSSRDAKGYFARFFVGFDPNTASGLPGGNYSNNSYTGPGDALDPQPYSGYSRLEPFDPDHNGADR